MPRQTNKQNSFLLYGDGEWHTNGLVVVGKYTQTRQRLLRAKIVKFNHGRHYKGALVMYRKKNTSTMVLRIGKPRTRKQVLRKRSNKKKDKKRGILEENKRKR